MQVNPAEMFNSWARRHGRRYALHNDVKEFEYRLAVWQDNLAYITQYNARYTSHWVRNIHTHMAVHPVHPLLKPLHSTSADIAPLTGPMIVSQ